MENELTPEQKFNAESPETMVPRALLQGRNHEAVIADLMRLDWSPKAARKFVERVDADIKRYQASPESRAALIKECLQEMIGGLIIVFLGVLITILGFFMFAEGYVWIILWGVIIYGLITTHRGHARWRLYRKDILPLAPNK